MTFEEASRRIKRGDLVELRHALDGGLDPNLANRFGWTLLMICALEGSVAAGELFLARGANVATILAFGDNALSLAALKGHIPFMKLLLQNGATVDRVEPRGWNLAKWIRTASGLRQKQIRKVLDLLAIEAPAEPIRHRSWIGDIGRFLRTWRTTGAVSPSGKALARRMAAQVDPHTDDFVLELGPGTGVVTEALIRRGIAPERIIAVEYNADFCRIVAERCPGVRVVRGDAYNLGATLSGIHAGPYAAVVSSLPLLLRPPEDRRGLVLDVLRRLAPGGAMIQFSYSPKPPVPASPADYSLDGSGWILMNLPPARVWTYRPIAL